MGKRWRWNGGGWDRLRHHNGPAADRHKKHNKRSWFDSHILYVLLRLCHHIGWPMDRRQAWEGGEGVWRWIARRHERRVYGAHDSTSSQEAIARDDVVYVRTSRTKHWLIDVCFYGNQQICVLWIRFHRQTIAKIQKSFKHFVAFFTYRRWKLNMR